MPAYRRNLKFWSFLDPMASVEATKQAIIGFQATQNTLKTKFTLDEDFFGTLSIATQLRGQSEIDLDVQGGLSLAFPFQQTFTAPLTQEDVLTVEQMLAEHALLCAALHPTLTQEQALNQIFAFDASGLSNLSIGTGFSHFNTLSLTVAGTLAAAAALRGRFALDTHDTASWLMQGQNLRTQQVLLLDTDPHLTAGAALTTQQKLNLGIYSELTIGNTFTMRNILALRLKALLSVAYRLSDYQEIDLEFRQTARQEHFIRQKINLSLDAHAVLAAGHRLRLAQQAVLSLSAQLIAGHALRLKQILAPDVRGDITVPQMITSAFLLQSALKSGLRQGTPLQNQHRLSLALTQRLSVLSKLAAVFDARLSLAPTLRQVAFLRNQYGTYLSTSAILRQAARLVSSSNLVLTPKTAFRQAAPLKQTFALQASLAGTFRNAHYLKVKAELSLALRSAFRASQPLVSKPTLTVQTQNNPRQSTPLKQTLTLSTALLSVLRQNAPLKTNPNLVTTLTANLNPPNSYEVETYAILNRMNPVPPTVAARNAMNTYIKNLKTAGIWSLLDFIYVLAASNTANAVLNWVSTKYTATQVNAPTFTAGKGFTFNKTGAYLNTGHDPSAGTTIFSQNNAHYSTRTLNTVGTTARDIGRGNAFINAQTTGGNPQAALNGATNTFTLTGFSGTNHFLINRGNAMGFDLWSLTGGPVTAALNGSAALSTGQTTIGDTAIISNRQIAFASAGGVMTSAQARTFITETTTLLTALGAI